ncbi:MAG: hypothetical protein F8N39_11465 [Clostridiaceae bacterium]|nr:hypothetical protein [Clostridiaceae bacterium]
MTTITLYKIHSGFVNKSPAWSLEAHHMDEFKGDVAENYELPEGFYLGRTTIDAPAIFVEGEDFAADIEYHPAGRPQLITLHHGCPVLTRVK